MRYLRSPKAIALVSTALFFANLVWMMNTKKINGTLNEGLEKQKLKSEALLSEKLLLEKDLQKMKEQFLSLKDRNSQLDDAVKNAESRLERQQAEYDRMKKDNLSLAHLKKQRVELLAIQNQLQNDLQSRKYDYDALVANNNELKNTIVSLEERNRLLTDDLNRALFASIDRTEIHAVKGKSEKLTVRAAKTRKLIAEFEVPSSMKDLSFRIIDSKGTVVTPKDGIITSTTAPSEKSFTASADPQVAGIKLQKVEMVYQPKQKLKSGVYTVEILNENLYVSSLKVKLK